MLEVFEFSRLDVPFELALLGRKELAQINHGLPYISTLPHVAHVFLGILNLIELLLNWVSFMCDIAQMPEISRNYMDSNSYRRSVSDPKIRRC